mmetsp:Transcript_33789/g.41630  ORF Transcript_33789/g.41630 Transcript_33789/m.41630 type:complete len:402 (+) Transcript_33789:109-1314(+)
MDSVFYIGDAEFERINTEAIIQPCSPSACASPGQCQDDLDDLTCFLLFEDFPNVSTPCDRINEELAEEFQAELDALTAAVTCTRKLPETQIKVMKYFIHLFITFPSINVLYRFVDKQVFLGLEDGIACVGKTIATIFTFGAVECEEDDIVNAEIQTFGGQEVPCDVNPELLTLSGQRAVVSQYQQEIDGVVASFEESSVETAQQILAEISLQIQRGSDLYIIYVCLTLFMTSPLILYSSKMSVRIKRRYFTLDQSFFIFLFVLFFWTYPLLEEAFSSFEVLKYLHNAQVDVCYIDADFLSQLRTTIGESCDAMDQLNQNNSAFSFFIQQTNLVAGSYDDCNVAGNNPYLRAIPDLYETFEEYVNISELPFVGKTCDGTDPSILFDTLSIAPGKPPEGESHF